MHFLTHHQTFGLRKVGRNLSWVGGVFGTVLVILKRDYLIFFLEEIQNKLDGSEMYLERILNVN